MTTDIVAASLEDDMWRSHTERVLAEQPRIAAFLEEVTGWRGCNNLAEYVVQLIIANQGTSGGDPVRPPCWQSHAPATVQQHAEQLSEALKLPVDDPFIQEQSVKYRQQLLERFGLTTP